MGEERKETAVEAKGRGWRWKRWLAIALLCPVPAVLLLLVVAWFALPWVLPFVTFPDVIVDLSENMKDTPPGLFPDQTLVAKYGVGHKDGSYRVTAKGRVLGWPFTASADIRLKPKFWGLDAEGSADFRMDGSALGVSAAFTASVPGGWSADMEMPKTPISENDPYLKSLLSRHPEAAVRKLVFDGAISLAAHAEQTGIFRGVPKWEAKTRIEQLDASVDANGKPVRIENFRMGFKASGIAEHVDLGPMYPHIDCIESAGMVLSNTFASVRATETAFLVTEAGADFCGGNLHLYALFLDPKKLNAGVTLYIDGIDAGQVLTHVNGFRGDATGKLNGKLPLRLINGETIKLGKGYLHSVPGETGNLKIYDPEPITQNLKMSGVSQDTIKNLESALANLDYSALKIGLVPEGEDSMALTMKLEGTATRGGVSVPVSFTVTLHGHLEQLINTGLRVATRKEHKK